MLWEVSALARSAGGRFGDGGDGAGEPWDLPTTVIRDMQLESALGTGAVNLAPVRPSGIAKRLMWPGTYLGDPRCPLGRV